jgi:hypothetical protein
VGLPADRERKRESEVKDIKHRDPHMRRRSMRLNALLHCTALHCVVMLMNRVAHLHDCGQHKYCGVYNGRLELSVSAHGWVVSRDVLLTQR